MAGRWVRPHEVNDWEYITTVLGDPHNKNYRDMKKMYAGEWAVRWPEGYQEIVTVVERDRVGSYREQGSPWPTQVRSSRFFILTKLHGEAVEIPVTVVDVWLED